MQKAWNNGTAAALDAAAWVDQTPVTGRCLFCDVTFQGPFAELRDWSAAHALSHGVDVRVAARRLRAARSAAGFKTRRQV